MQEETRRSLSNPPHVQILRLPNYDEVIMMPLCRTSNSNHSCVTESDVNNVSSTLALIHQDCSDSQEINNGCCWKRKCSLSLCCVTSSPQRHQIGRFCGIGCGVALLFLLAGASFFTTAVLRQNWQPMGWIGFAFFTAGFTLILVIISVVFSGWIAQCNSNISESALYRCRHASQTQSQARHLQQLAPMGTTTLHTSRQHRCRTHCCSHWRPPPPSYQESEIFADSQIMILEHSNWTAALSRPPSYQSRQNSANEALETQAAIYRTIYNQLETPSLRSNEITALTSTCLPPPIENDVAENIDGNCA